MKLSAKFIEPATIKADCIVLAVIEGKTQPAAVTALAKEADFPLAKQIKEGAISTDCGKTSAIYISATQTTWLLVGMGDGTSLTIEAYRKAIAAATQVVAKAKHKHVAWCLHMPLINNDAQSQSHALAQSICTADYQFTQCKSKPAKAHSMAHTLIFDAESKKAVKQGLASGQAVGEGMNLTRELGDLPGNMCTPTYLSKQARALAKESSSLTVNVLSEKQMKSLGMNSLLSVSEGSIEPAQLIVMNYQGAKKSDAPIVLVGKGVTFDTGGISLKPGAGMDEMKYDMCGAASVFGVIKTLTALDSNINVIGVVAAVENMPSDRATKPGDIVTSMSGQTIEILNTDAEGRLVLCDALTYVERYKPKAVIDIATLTGACVVALGKHASAIYSHDDTLAQALLSAGLDSGDKAWRMPLWDEYQPQLDSNFADMANIGGRDGGSITAACFLSRFAKAYTWAHMDIAGTAWVSGAKKGATGRPVPLLINYLLSQ